MDAPARERGRRDKLTEGNAERDSFLPTSQGQEGQDAGAGPTPSTCAAALARAGPAPAPSPIPGQHCPAAPAAGPRQPVYFQGSHKGSAHVPVCAWSVA